jgi:cytochrome oxidase Cu insertion factor (SCO1/SenC/PrrC family)
MKKSYWRYIVWFISTFLLIGGILFYQLKNTPLSYVQNKPSQGRANIGGPFSLKDQNGTIRNSNEFKGKFMLIYFGYSFCPDVCPLGLQNMSQALNLLQRDREQIIPIFITIDPARDTVDHLKVYATNFHPNFIMLTGSQTEIDRTLKLFRVYSEKSTEITENNKDYLMDHSTLIYLMDKDGNFLQQFPHSIDPETLAVSVQKYFLSKK